MQATKVKFSGLIDIWFMLNEAMFFYTKGAKRSISLKQKNENDFLGQNVETFLIITFTLYQNFGDRKSYFVQNNKIVQRY